MTSDVLKEAFAATVSRDYEKAVNVIRQVVGTEHAFGVEELELIDHVYSCILNTSHYDESLIEVCWEWIDAIERAPRIVDTRVVSSSQLSIYYAYHTICRVQERMPRRPTHLQIRRDTWSRITQSFSYLWTTATQLWKAYELDRLDVLCSWSYMSLQFADVVDDNVLSIIETSKESAKHVLATTIVVENSHQAGERIRTIERNVKEARRIKTDKFGRKIAEKQDAVLIRGTSSLLPQLTSMTTTTTTSSTSNVPTLLATTATSTSTALMAADEEMDDDGVADEDDDDDDDDDDDVIALTPPEKKRRDDDHQSPCKNE